MIEQIFIAILLGVTAGTFTGIIPGLHINFIALILFLFSSLLLKFTEPLVVAVFIISMSTAHTFVDFIPSIFLGAPNEDTALSVLPGHKLLLNGFGYSAVKLTTLGCFFGALTALALTPFFIIIVPLFYNFIAKIMAFLLIFIVFLLIIKEKKKFLALLIFLFSGILGIAVLNFKLIKQPLFPLFSGLFGVSLLLISFFQNVKIPEQKIKSLKLDKKEFAKTLSLSIFSSSLVSFLPGVGSAQAAVISSAFKKIKERYFLVLIGAVNMIVLLLSFVALYVIQKPRSGVAVFTGKFLESFYFSQQQLFLLLFSAVVVASFSVFVTLFFGRFFAKNINKINYKTLCLAIIILITILTPIISGWLSLIVLATATSLGIVVNIIGIRKIHMMGCLLLPVIIWYLPF